MHIWKKKRKNFKNSKKPVTYKEKNRTPLRQGMDNIDGDNNDDDEDNDKTMKMTLGAGQ
jgi:hypothetical protein